ncbi:MAG: phosphoribosylamine--glycine ligase [Flavobacteriales bacterium]
MKVLLLGSGGREHAIAWKLVESSLLSELHIAPGNAGMEAIRPVQPILVNNLDPMDFQAVKRYAKRHDIQLVVVGPEAPLVGGLADALEKEGISVIGPGANGAQLEGSKDFAKTFMARHNIPTAAYRSFDATELEEAIAFLDSFQAPYVLKADGLAAGKGVVIVDSKQEAAATLRKMLVDQQFGEAGNKVVIEEFLDGIEVSMFAITDGKSFHLLPSAKDYKRVGEGDTGLNTGGMGAISPVPFVTPEFQEKALNQIIIPTIKGLQADGIEYKGFLFFGLMKVGGDPYVIEYNCRLGDPETEVILPRLKSDLLHLFDSLSTGLLSEYDMVLDERATSTVILASSGYPEGYEKGEEISGADVMMQNGMVFHAGTKMFRNKLVTNGGRVLALTGWGVNLQDALKNSYTLADKITFAGSFFRKDIGKDCLN